MLMLIEIQPHYPNSFSSVALYGILLPFRFGYFTNPHTYYCTDLHILTRGLAEQDLTKALLNFQNACFRILCLP